MDHVVMQTVIWKDTETLTQRKGNQFPGREEVHVVVDGGQEEGLNLLSPQSSLFILYPRPSKRCEVKANF